jgi:hypothetical protein
VTLTQALLQLYRLGRVQSPWLPGMQVQLVATESPHPRGRILSLWDHGGVEEIAWTPDSSPIGYRRSWTADHAVDALELDLTDPATEGCLRALFREARQVVRFQPSPESLAQALIALAGDARG